MAGRKRLSQEIKDQLDGLIAETVATALVEDMQLKTPEHVALAIKYIQDKLSDLDINDYVWDGEDWD